MPVTIASYEFHGPYGSADALQDRPGIYAVLDILGPMGGMQVLDLGEAEAVRARVLGHERGGCWAHHARGRLALAVLYTDGLSAGMRLALEEALVAQARPPCRVG